MLSIKNVSSSIILIIFNFMEFLRLDDTQYILLAFIKFPLKVTFEYPPRSGSCPDLGFSSCGSFCYWCSYFFSLGYCYTVFDCYFFWSFDLCLLLYLIFVINCTSPLYFRKTYLWKLVVSSEGGDIAFHQQGIYFHDFPHIFCISVVDDTCC